jgi:hypothetical protein
MIPGLGRKGENADFCFWTVLSITVLALNTLRDVRNRIARGIRWVNLRRLLDI